MHVVTDYMYLPQHIYGHTMMDSRGKEGEEGPSSATTPWQQGTADQAAFPRLRIALVVPVHTPASRRRKAEERAHKEWTRSEKRNSNGETERGETEATETCGGGSSENNRMADRDTSQPAERKSRVLQCDIEAGQSEELCLAC